MEGLNGPIQVDTNRFIWFHLHTVKSYGETLKCLRKFVLHYSVLRSSGIQQPSGWVLECKLTLWPWPTGQQKGCSWLDTQSVNSVSALPHIVRSVDLWDL